MSSFFFGLLGEPLPEDLLIASKRWDHVFFACDTLRQIWISVLDQILHGEASLRGFRTSTQIANELHEKYTKIKSSPETSFHQHISHIISYVSSLLFRSIVISERESKSLNHFY
jgi:Zn-dependent oligopeptidase